MITNSGYLCYLKFVKKETAKFKHLWYTPTLIVLILWTLAKIAIMNEIALKSMCILLLFFFH